MANVAHVIGIVILIFAKCAIGNINVDNVLLPESLRNNIFNGTQKYWAYYTSKITEMVTRNSLFLESKVQKELNLINVVQRLYSKIKFFKQIAMYIDAASIGTTMVTRPLGKLRKHSPLTQGFAICRTIPGNGKNSHPECILTIGLLGLSTWQEFSALSVTLKRFIFLLILQLSVTGDS